jgi:glycosyltransferase involved in cell wall biosynthesis
MKPINDVIFLANWSRMVTYDFGHVAAAFGRSRVRARALVADELEPQFEGVAAPGVVFESLPYKRRDPRLLDVVRTLERVRRLAAEHQHALFVVFTVHAILLCGTPLRLFDRRTAYFVTGMGTVFGSDDLRYRLARVVVKRLFRLLFSAPNALAVTQNSEDLEVLVHDCGIRRDKVTCIPGCGADPEEFPFFEHFVPKPRKVILVPARILPDKGVREAIAASRLLTHRGVDHEMWFSGGIDYGNPRAIGEEELRELARESPDVRFIGWQEHIGPLLEQSDIVCVPTFYREGLPKALVEASACGRPIVTTDTIGPREIVQHQRNGLLVPVRDPVALADALQTLLGDDALAERLRRNAYTEFLARHTRVDNLRQTLRVLERLGDVNITPNADTERPASRPPRQRAELSFGVKDTIGIYWPAQVESQVGVDPETPDVCGPLT